MSSRETTCSPKSTTASIARRPEPQPAVSRVSRCAVRHSVHRLIALPLGGVSRMRVALVSPPFLSVPPADYGGTELVIAELARSLTKRGHETVVYATGDSHL